MVWLILILRVWAGDREVDHLEVDHPVKMASNTGMDSCLRISIGLLQMEV
tara:strand:- start:612 stop:761 length:150 start_codon:yes stop_codon:yes gene_type:complete